MKILENHIDFVNSQIEFHLSHAKIYSEKPYREKKHLETAGKFSELLGFLEECVTSEQKSLLEKNNPTKPRQLRLNLIPQDIEGLPEELINELSISSADKTEFAITSMIEEFSGIMSLDQILVELYKQTGEIHKRTTLTNRLYRMVQRETIYSVPGKKGVYSSKPMSEQEVLDRLELNKMFD